MSPRSAFAAQSFSSVVGPNGSGKSNVIDAMLFVFGKRAKQLRLNKVSELIHNSTDFRNLQYARVEVHFHEIVDSTTDEEAFAPVAGSDFVIAREAYKNNTSKYFIDAKTSSFTEVTTLLKTHGVDLNNNRFLILQGEVEQISMMKPKGQTPGDEGLLEYLEDIIGTNQYVDPIEEKAKALETLNDQRGGQVNRLKLVEKERDALGGAKAEAETFMAKEREVAAAKSLLLQRRGADARAELKRVAAESEALRSRLEQEKGRHDEHSEAIETLEAQHAEHAAALAALRADLAAATAFADFEKKDIQHRENLKNMKQRAKKLDEKLVKDNKSGTTWRRRRARSKRLCRARGEEGEPGPVSAPRKQSSSRCSSRSRARCRRRRGAEAARAALSPWEGKIADAKARADVATAERDVLVSQKRRAAQAAGGQAGRGEGECRRRRQDADIADAEATLAAERARALGAAGGAAARAQEAAASAAAREVRGKLEQKRTSADAERSKGVIVSSLMKAKSRGELRGVLGRLGDLGAIDAKYDVAVSTACGALDYVVVETTADAQACVAHLRAHNLGVATFLILEKQKALEGRMREAKAAAAKEKVTRLMDLIRPADSRVAVAFYYGVRDTAVADDLDAAARSRTAAPAAARRDLAGQLIETAGTMSGGGAGPRAGACARRRRVSSGRRGGRRVLPRRWLSGAELARSSATAAEARAAATAAMKEAKEAETAVAKMERRLPGLRADVAAAEERAGDLSSRLADSRRRRPPLRGPPPRSRLWRRRWRRLPRRSRRCSATRPACARRRMRCKRPWTTSAATRCAQRATVKALTEGIAEAAEATLEKRALRFARQGDGARFKAIEEASAERAAHGGREGDERSVRDARGRGQSVMETQKTTQLAVDEKAGRWLVRRRATRRRAVAPRGTSRWRSRRSWTI